MNIPEKYKKMLGFLYILIGALLEFSSNEPIPVAEEDNLPPITNKGAL